MKLAMLAPVAWRTPPEHYGPWESIASLLTEGSSREESMSRFWSRSTR